jgi:two-component system, NtrC family, sensor kinase
MQIAAKLALATLAWGLVVVVATAAHRTTAGNRDVSGPGPIGPDTIELWLLCSAAFAGGVGFSLALGAVEVKKLRSNAEAKHARLLLDITTEEERLEALRKADRQAAVSKVASIVGHELGTPLNVIAARAAMIADGESSAAEITQSAKIIVEQSARMSKTIKDVLGNVRSKKGARAPLEVAELVRESTSFVSRLADRRRVSIEVEGELEAHRIEVDGHRMVQVLTNLITNGIQAMPRGGEIRIRVSRVPPSPEEHRAPTGYSCISVIDTGVGIPAEKLKVIFKPFHADTSHAAPGTGLSLAVAEGIVREHGGWVDVESQVDRGSCFKVCLPVGG